jgi:hypothetical protein
MKNRAQLIVHLVPHYLHDVMMTTMTLV